MYLVLGQVSEDGPAYESGLRSGDVIVTVSDWLITVMDRPQVSIIQCRIRIKLILCSGCSSSVSSRS